MMRDRLGRRRGSVLLVLLLALAGSLAACDSDQGQLPRPRSTDTAPTTLTFGVWGSPPEIAAFQSVVDTYNQSATGVEVTIESWPTAEALAESMSEGNAPADVFLLSRQDLPTVTAGALNKPLLELVDERGIDFGDGYSRDAVLAFSEADELQCMPYGISPMVVYYNRDLIDFGRMADRGLPAPTPVDEEVGPDERTYLSWTFEQFRAAAEFASRPRQRTKGIHVDPTLRGLAPFVYSGGGDLFDDDVAPTSLELSSDETREALRPTLELLRDPALTLTAQQLRQAPPIDWFKRGRLAMMAGFRSVLPELRDVPRLDFDVMPMPVIDSPATVGDISGLCIAAQPTATIPQAADFLVYAVSAEAVARVAIAGYLVPANLQVAASADFLQPSLRPAGSEVFISSIGDLRLLPLIDSFRELEAAVKAPLRQLLTMPVPDVEAITQLIDEQSRPVLDPELGSETPTPSETPTD